MPEPPWHTTAVHRGSTSSWGTNRSTRTLGGIAPTPSGSPAGPTVTSTSSATEEAPSTAARNPSSTSLNTVPNVT